MAEYDLISKTALLRQLDMAIDCKDCPRNTDRKTYYDRCACTEIQDICDTITDFETFADVQPVKHGKWKHEEQGYDVYVECSECGLNLSTSDYIENEWREILKYCPCCGARMDGEQNEL